MTWEQRINRAIKENSFNEEDRKLSASYKTCAIDEKFTYEKFDNLDFTNRKKYLKLLDLGAKFCGGVNANNFIKVKKIYNQIQRYKTL